MKNDSLDLSRYRLTDIDGRVDAVSLDDIDDALDVLFDTARDRYGVADGGETDWLAIHTRNALAVGATLKQISTTIRNGRAAA